MNHLIVLAHPRKESFTHRVSAVWSEAVVTLGHTVILRDLYALNFNPVADAEEAVTRPLAPPKPDVAAEMALLQAADVVTFIAPVWWIGPPAILKGWLDRVLRGGGFAYGYGPAGPSGMLKNKRGMVFTSAGSTPDEFIDSRKLDAIHVMWAQGVVEFCGIRLLEHIHFGPVGSRTKPDQIAVFLTEVQSAAQRHFGAGQTWAETPICRDQPAC
jgi:NAD(P)H dehydrogenase (quinone)